jgi:hypothetical protein
MDKRMLVPIQLVAATCTCRAQKASCQVEPRKHLPIGACNSRLKKLLAISMLTTCPCHITLLQHSPVRAAMC